MTQTDGVLILFVVIMLAGLGLAIGGLRLWVWGRMDRRESNPVYGAALTIATVGGCIAAVGLVGVIISAAS